MVVGLPYAGKTCAWRVLSRALDLVAERGEIEEHAVTCHVINPKAITIAQLYGFFRPISHEWVDGVLANKFRQLATDT